MNDMNDMMDNKKTWNTNSNIMTNNISAKWLENPPSARYSRYAYEMNENGDFINTRLILIWDPYKIKLHPTYHPWKSARKGSVKFFEFFNSRTPKTLI